MGPFLERLFELLFKYRPFLFAKGRFVMGPVWPALIVLAVGAAAVVLSYRRARGAARPPDRIGLALVRTAALALVLFALCRPGLILSTVVPQQSFLGVLVDDSQSMRIAEDGETRGAIAARSFGPKAALLAALADRYKLRLFRFSSTAERLPSVSDLAFDGRETSLARALEGAGQELS